MAITSKSLSLGEAVSNYLSDVSSGTKNASQAEVSRFARWYGKERSISGLTPAEVERFAERLSISDADYLRKLELVKAFLAYVKKKEWTKTNLSIHLKSKRGKAKTSGSAKKGSGKKRGATEAISMTRQGHVELNEELNGLKDERHKVIAEVRKAAADKDFRENVPFHAAREKRGHIEGRIMEIEGILKAAIVVETKKSSSLTVNIGDTVFVCELNSEEEMCYTLVGPKEADVIRGKISSASPMGQAILGREQGETVEILAPVGKLSYQIKRIQR